MADLVVLDGSTFFVSSPSGDPEPGEASGFFHADVRHLSTWDVRVDGEPLRVLTSGTVDYYSARIFATLASARVGENPPVSIWRHRLVSDGIHEDLFVENHSEAKVRLTLEVRFGADFADIFEIKDRRPKRGRSWVELEDGRATLWYERDDFRRGTVLDFGAPCSLEQDHATFELQLEPRARWHTCVDVSVAVEGRELGPRNRCGAFGKPQPNMPLSFEEWMEDAPTLETQWDALGHTYRQSLVDLAALRFRPRKDLTWSLPAAGLPWFMALFGRDSIITAYQALPFQNRLAHTTLEALAALQATDYDDYRDAEPGKIPHELRQGELAKLGEVPHDPYYGTHDATPLFLVLLDEYERWSGDAEAVRTFEPAARAALAWVDRDGDMDGDGYLEYRTRSSKGLENQCWKDSWNSILFADGRPAEGPIATCEIQGYVYDAKLRAARLAREVWADPELGERLAREAAELKRRFNEDFWMPGRECFALALDGDKRHVDSITSNIGHLLWSGIVDEDKIPNVVAHLMGERLFSGWGVRTMAEGERGYNPIEYHNGTVWPHDNSLIAAGLARFGYREEAARIALAMLDAAAYFAYRLPEVFAGYPRSETEFPVEYPTASRPQAWATGAPLLLLRALLGLEPGGEELRVDPALPREIGDVALRGIAFRGGRVDATAVGDAVAG